MALSCSNVTYQAILTWQFLGLSVLLPPFSSLAIPHLKICCCFQSLSRVQLFVTPWTIARQGSLSITNSRACSNSCPSSLWYHPTISSSVVLFSSCSQSYPASGSFPMNQFFTSGDQRIEFSASASVLPVNMQDWFLLEWTGWICLQSKGLSSVFSNTTVQKHQFRRMLGFLYGPVLTSIHDYWKNHSFD